MPKICYVEKTFSPATLKVIKQANEIIAEYEAQGFELTLRQLYYQFVSRDLIPNQQKEYKRLGSIVNDARLAGLIDWNRIRDLTREIEENSHWYAPESIIESAAESFRIDLWADQKYRPEIWIEKDALKGVFLGVCQNLDVPLLSCRGYTSQSEMWRGAQRLARHFRQHNQFPVIFHFGDHDPSGIDMTRDITDRLQLFMGRPIQLERLALSMEQIQQYKPPPNPAKETDSRFAGYIAKFGEHSWELDALEPKVLADLVRTAVTNLIDKPKWEAAAARMERGRRQLKNAAENWATIVDEVLEDGGDE